MDDVKEINIKEASNGWFLTLTDSDGSKEYELFEYDVHDEIDLSPDRDGHKLITMKDLLITVGRKFLQLDPESQETVVVAVEDRLIPEPSPKSPA